MSDAVRGPLGGNEADMTFEKRSRLCTLKWRASLKPEQRIGQKQEGRHITLNNSNGKRVKGDPVDETTLRRLGCGQLADGMCIFRLPHFPDDRGSLTEVCRNSWVDGRAPVQWNCVRSKAQIMRGLHIHLRYHEYYVVLSGSLTVGFEDVREGSPTQNLVGVFTVKEEDHLAVASPPGVLHGLYFPEETVLLAGAGLYHSLDNELGCHWKDPDVSIPWPFKKAIVSERDDSQPRLKEILSQVPVWQA